MHGEGEAREMTAGTVGAVEPHAELTSVITAVQRLLVEQHGLWVHDEGGVRPVFATPPWLLLHERMVVRWMHPDPRTDPTVRLGVRTRLVNAALQAWASSADPATAALLRPATAADLAALGADRPNSRASLELEGDGPAGWWLFDQGAVRAWLKRGRRAEREPVPGRAAVDELGGGETAASAMASAVDRLGDTLRELLAPREPEPQRRDPLGDYWLRMLVGRLDAELGARGLAPIEGEQLVGRLERLLAHVERPRVLNASRPVSAQEMAGLPVGSVLRADFATPMATPLVAVRQYGATNGWRLTGIESMVGEERLLGFTSSWSLVDDPAASTIMYGAAGADVSRVAELAIAVGESVQVRMPAGSVVSGVARRIDERGRLVVEVS